MRKNGFSGWIVTGLVFCLAAGCSQDKLDTYDSTQNSVYFGMLNTNTALSNEFVDTTVFSFGDYELLDDTIVQIQVNALGGYYSESREFEFEVVDSLTTAKEGIHFTLPESRTGVIPANATCGYIPVHIRNSTEMESRAMWYLVLQLKANANFSLDLKREYVDKVNNRYVDLTRHSVGMSARIQKPRRWDTQARRYLGDFSVTKYKLVNRLCGLTKADWDVISYYEVEVYWVWVRNYLQDKINKGEPEMDTDDFTGREKPMVVEGLTGI